MPAPKKTTTKNNASKATKANNNQNGGVAVAENPQPVSANKTLNTTQAKAGTTQIVAQIDVGFGNFLAIRGEGAGLNWNSGQKMTYQQNAWVWNGNAQKGFQFKVLLNDQVWAQGENLTAKAGAKNVFKPQF